MSYDAVTLIRIEAKLVGTRSRSISIIAGFIPEIILSAKPIEL